MLNVRTVIMILGSVVASSTPVLAEVVRIQGTVTGAQHGEQEQSAIEVSFLIPVPRNEAGLLVVSSSVTWAVDALDPEADYTMLVDSEIGELSDGQSLQQRIQGASESEELEEHRLAPQDLRRPNPKLRLDVQSSLEESFGHGEFTLRLMLLIPSIRMPEYTALVAKPPTLEIRYGYLGEARSRFVDVVE